MAGKRIAAAIPEERRIVMGMSVDEAGCKGRAARLEDRLVLNRKPGCNLDDPPVADANNAKPKKVLKKK